MNYYRLSLAKYKRAVKISKLLRYIPGIYLIAVCNSLSYNKALPDSDIDLFIITAQNRIWTVRFIALFFLHILGLRPGQGGKNKDKVCLSFFVTQNNLNLEKYKICPQDNYLRFWIANLKPLYDQKKMYKKFVQKNKWANLENKSYFIPNYKRKVRKSILKPFLDLLGSSVLEILAKKIQLKIMPKKLKKTACSLDSKVIISNQILKFHLNDRRLCFQKKF